MKSGCSKNESINKSFNSEENSYMVGTTSKSVSMEDHVAIGPITCKEIRSLGPILIKDSSVGPISFDSACRKVKKKNGILKDLGEKVEVRPSFFASIAPKNFQSQNFAIKEAAVDDSNEDQISNGMFNPCLSHTDSEVTRCNHRLLGPAKSEVGRKIRNSTSRLGVTVSGNDSVGIEKVKRLEQREMEEGTVKMGSKLGVP